MLCAIVHVLIVVFIIILGTRVAGETTIFVNSMIEKHMPFV
jgi:hypothetical protein